MVRAATDAGFGPQSGISSIKPLTALVDLSLNPKHPGETPALYMEDEQLLGIVIGCVIGVCCILVCTTSIVLKRQCMKGERARDTPHNTLGNDVAYCAQHLRPLTVDHVQHEESVPLKDTNYITRHMDGRGSGGRYSNNMSGMALLPLLDSSNVGDDDLTNVHIIENPQVSAHSVCNCIFVCFVHHRLYLITRCFMCVCAYCISVYRRRGCIRRGQFVE